LRRARQTTIGFEPHARQVYGWAYRLLGRHHEALDVVQDVFLRWDQQCATSAPTQPRGWLRRVTWNRAMDVCRRWKADADAAARMGRPEVAAAESHAPLDRGALRADLAAALERLSDAQREVLLAKVYDDMTFAQIAAELGLAVSTVKTHYLRAVRALRDHLRPRWADEGDL
jgi:RNA polymerase sigma-70 factor (ECF subfamily)